MKRAITFLSLAALAMTACSSAEPLVVTADELMSAWETDKSPYLGQTVQVTGTVDKAEMTPMVGFKVFLGEADGWTNFQCLMTAEGQAAAEGLAQGDEVTLLGTMTKEDTLAASASECTVVE